MAALTPLSPNFNDRSKPKGFHSPMAHGAYSPMSGSGGPYGLSPQHHNPHAMSPMSPYNNMYPPFQGMMYPPTHPQQPFSYGPQQGGSMHNGLQSVRVNLFPTNPSPMKELPVPQRLEELKAAFQGSVVAAACSSFGRSQLQGLLQDGAAALVLEPIMADIGTVALDPNGCHVLRTLMEVLPDALAQSILPMFNETLVLNMCTLSQYTRLPLIQLFERPALDVQYIVEILCTNVQYLAATQQGVIALNRMFQLSNPTQRAMMVSPVLPLLANLATDPIGNYFVQCIVEHSGKVQAARYVAEGLGGRLFELSQNKFASNVVEKVVRCVNVPVVRKRVMDEIGASHGTSIALLETVLSDPYANFVAQAIIDTATSPAELKRLHDRIRPLLAQSPYGTKIESRLKTKTAATPPRS